MENRGQLIIGGAVILIGVIVLVGTLTGIHLWRFIWPIALIVIGAWLVFRPRMVGPGTGVRLQLLGDVRLRAPFETANQEIWLGIGDVVIDLTAGGGTEGAAQILGAGETRVHVYGFIGDITLRVPEGTAVAVDSSAFIVDAKFLGERRNSILSPVRFATNGYDQAERRLKLETICFITNIKVRHG